MSTLIDILMLFGGVGIVVFFAERLVEGAVRAALALGLSTFFVSVVFIGFDPENLVVGVVGSTEGSPGIALGSVIGAAMVAVGLAFGVTALFAPLRFETVSRPVVTLPVVALALFAALAADGELSRIDGGVLLAGFVGSLWFMLRRARAGDDIRAAGEAAEAIEASAPTSTLRAVGLLVLSLAGIVAGSELLVSGAESIVARHGLSDTAFGMTVVALAVSIEELARELPAARRGRPDIAYGNVAGSILAFFLCNAGMIALVHPVPVSDRVLRALLPVSFVTVALITIAMLRRHVGRVAGLILIALYVGFVVASFLA